MRARAKARTKARTSNADARPAAGRESIVKVRAQEQRMKGFVLMLTRIRGFSGCGFELIAGLKVELGLDRVDLVGGNGRDDVNEGVDHGSMPGKVEG